MLRRNATAGGGDDGMDVGGSVIGWWVEGGRVLGLSRSGQVRTTLEKNV